MEQVILFLLTFLVVYLIYLFLIILRKKKLDKYDQSTEMRYLAMRYQLNMKKLNMKKIAHILALTNAFIIATTVTVMSLISDFILGILVAFVTLFPLILICYHIIGSYYKKKEGK